MRGIASRSWWIGDQQRRSVDPASLGLQLRAPDQAVPVNVRSAATTSGPRYGFGTNTLPAGRSPSATRTRPDVAMILIGGHRFRTKWASFRPSIEPGIWISVKTT